MTNFFSSLSPESLLENLRNVTKRFPLSVLLIAIVTGCWYYIVNSDPTDLFIPRVIFTDVVTFFLSVGVYLYLETWKRAPLDRWFPILPILYGVWFYFTVDIRESVTTESITYFLLHLVGFLSLLFFAPYLARIFHGEEGSIEYTNYFSRIAWVVLMSGIVGVTLVILGFIAIGSVIALFDLSSFVWDEKLYGNWAVTALSLIAPLYALIHLPKWGDIDTKKYETNRFFAFLIRYVATPAIYVYFAILYAYSIRVLADFSHWPKGMVTWLVIGFSSFGYLVYIFSKSYEDSRVVATFRRYFPYVVIPQIGMLAYAIYLRIAQYDLTMNRYFVVIFGLWLVGISLYYVISKRKSLAIIPASLSLISLLISLGPWSVFSYPQDRQEARLMRNLEQAKILQDGKIVPLTSERDISKELSTEIAGGIEYLCSFDDCARIKDIFPEQATRAEVKAREEWEKWNKNNTGSTYEGASYWEIQSAITSELRVQRYTFDDEKRTFTESEYLSYNIDYSKGQYPLNVRGYDTILQITNNISDKSQHQNVTYPYITLDVDDEKIVYMSEWWVVRDFSITFPEKLKNSSTLSPLSQEDLTFVVADDTMEIQLLFQSLMIRNPRYIPPADAPTKNIVHMDISSGIALVKEKK
jgi:hypothetical protein